MELSLHGYSRLRLTRRTSINSNSNFHKEKDMADYRKWFLALAVVAILLSLGTTPANAATPAPAFVCNANAGVPPLVRSEGITELVGDLILNCTGGQPTQKGSPIPLSNVTIFLQTNITSRIVGAGNLSE